MKNNYKCHCGCRKFDKGRALDGRRAYRCQSCKNIHTSGTNGITKRFNKQRHSYQFPDSKGFGHIL